MNSYVLPKLKAEHLEALKKAGIQYFKWNNGGILLENEDVYHDAIAVLGAEAQEQPGAEGLIFVSLVFENEVVATPVDDARAASRANYIRACAARLDQFVKLARDVFNQKKETLPKLEEFFANLTRRARFVNVDEAARKRQFEEEIEALRALPKVRDVRVSKDLREIYIYTTKLYATVNETNERYEIGQFLIRVQTDGTNDGVRFFNGTRRVNAIREKMNAPYIYRDGSMMTNELKATFVDLIARCEFASLADMAIQYVESLNDDAPARFVTNWPRVNTPNFLPNSQET